MIDSTLLYHAKDIKRLFKFYNHARQSNYELDGRDDPQQREIDEILQQQGENTPEGHKGG